MRRWMATAGAVLVLAGCTRTIVIQATPTTSVTATTTASPSPPTSSSPTLSAEDVSSVEGVVRDYFEAFDLADLLASARERARLSTGELNAWAGWLVDEGPAQGTSSTTTIDTLEMTGIQGDTALVDLDVTDHSDQPPDLHFTGPAKVQRTPDGWKLLDYVRNGRSQQASIFASPKGSAEKSGISVRVEGVVLQSDYIAVFLVITNDTSSKAELAQYASLVTPSGRQFGGGQYYSNYSASPHAHITTSFVWGSESLPLTTKGFRLTLSISGPSTFLDFDIPVRLTA